MLFAHMDQLGFVVRKIEANGLVRVERLGGVPEKALPSQAVLFCVGEGRDVPGVIANKSHHATTPEEKYRVLPYPELYIDAGFAQRRRRCSPPASMSARRSSTRRKVLRARRRPHRRHVGRRPRRLRGDARGGARAARRRSDGRRCISSSRCRRSSTCAARVTAAQALAPDIAIQLDLILATDTPDMTARGDVRLGGGPGDEHVQLPRPRHAERHHPASGAGRALRGDGARQRSCRCSGARISARSPTLSYVQLVGDGVAAIDLGFPARYTHSSLEVCDLSDLDGLTRLLVAGLARDRRASSASTATTIPQ